MERRNFIQKSIFGGISLPFISFSKNQTPGIVRAKSLNEKGTIGVIAPASGLTRSAFEKMQNNLAMLGFETKMANGVRSRAGFLAGSDKQRVDDLHQMFSDPGIDAIICARGGYGTSRILSMIDYDLIRQNPKPFIGFSDITALLSAFYKHAGLVGIHGPVAASTFNDFTIDYMMDLIQRGKKIKLKCENPVIISPGIAEGKLIGGNLSILASLIGTPYDVDYQDHIVFIEEIGENSYKIDRMLTQLIGAGKFKGIAGIALGYFTNCDTQPNDPYYEYSIGLNEVLQDRLGNLGVPVLSGFPFGHEDHNASIPIGITAILNTEKGQLKTLESAVI